MPSLISNFSNNIDEEYPIAGVDNDTQGFRDNFDAVKTALTVASAEVTTLQDSTAKIDSANNFGGFDQSNLNIASATDKTNNLQLIPGDPTLPFQIQYRNGPYQFATLQGDRTLQISWDIVANSVLEPGRRAKLTLQLSSDSAIESRLVAFAPSSAYLFDENFPDSYEAESQVTLSVGANPVIIELWTFDGGASIYAKYVGEFDDEVPNIVPVPPVSTGSDIPYTADTANSLQWVDGTYDFGRNIIKYANVIQAESELANYSAATYHGMTMHVHATGALYFAHAGAWRKLLTDNADGAATAAGYVDPLSTVAYQGTLGSLSDVSTAGVTPGQVLKYDGTQWVPASDLTADGGTGISLTDLSVTVQTAGAANLVYNTATGVFSFTPPVVPESILDLGIADGSTGQVLTTNGAGAFTFTTVSGGTGGIADIVEDTTPQLGGALDVNGNSIQYTFNVANAGSNDYTFADPGNHWFPATENDPVLYLRRGETYVFNVNAPGHPFQIKVSNGGSAYNSGVTNNGAQVGLVTFKVPMSAPTTLFYQCTLHDAMGNVINIV